MNAATDRLIIDIKKRYNKKVRISLSMILWNCILLFAIASNLLTAQSGKTNEGVNGNLVDVFWLKKNLNSEEILIIDASPAQIYKTKHIAGAISYDIFNYGPKELPVGEIEKRYQSWGISPGKKIVIYDQGGTFLATRLFFSLYYYGFPAEDLFVLDGGLSRWLEEGLPVTEEITPTPKKGSFTIKKLNEDVDAQLPEFLTASGDLNNNVLLEALDPNWHFGGISFFDKPGHIPNGIMTPSDEYFKPDKTFKSAEDIEKMMAYLEISTDQQIYTYCGGGIAASVPFFALKFILDYPKVKLFRGSQLEWISDQRDLPIWTYDAPYIMRDAQWLKFWGGKTARMYGISNLTILDVRPEKEFNDGHIPYAINIPSELFEINLNNPENLSELLSVAGVNASAEVVIVSGKGLAEESALAFISLQKLGQKKVSIFLDSEENWKKLGFTLFKDTVNSQLKMTGLETMNNQKLYTLNIQPGLIIKDPADTRGIYPKVFITSGEHMPLNIADNKVIHIPYTNFIDEDGAPKAANEIWNIISKAGVPRYAELICVSKEPGEAAVNYFIFKLMGFPDVKVWIN